jgi:DNA-binding GntR family transcriptional regulator
MKSKKVVRLDPIRYVTLTESVYRSIKEKILNHELALGARIRDEDLAEQLGVSRTPVREAIGILIRDGLVESVPRSQTRIRTLSEDDIEEIFDLRIALESLAARRAAERMDRTIVQRLRDMHEAAEAALKDGNPGPALKFDGEMHRAILAASGNERLKEMMVNINDYVTLFRNLSARTPAHRGFNFRHKEIVKALEREDGENASKYMAEHIMVAKVETQRDFEQQHLKESGETPQAKSKTRAAKS